MTTFERRIQLRSSRVNHHSTSWIIFFPRWSQPKDLESICNLGMEKRVFTVSRTVSSCYRAKALLFPVVKHYIKVVRDRE